MTVEKIMLIIGLLILFVFVLHYIWYKKNIRGSIVRTNTGKRNLYGILLRKKKKSHLFYLSQRHKSPLAYRHKKEKYYLDPIRFEYLDEFETLGKISYLRFLFLIFSLKRVERKEKAFFKGLFAYKMSDAYAALHQGYYTIFHYKRFNEKNIQKETLKKAREAFAYFGPLVNRDFEFIMKGYETKDYHFMNQSISLFDFTAKTLFDLSVFSKDTRKNFRQLNLTHYKAVYYAFVLDNPIVCSKHSVVYDREILNRHLLIHEHKDYYTEENYLRVLNMFCALHELHRSM